MESDEELKIYLEQIAPLPLFCLFKAPSMQGSVICYLETDGDLYAIMNDDNERGELCKTFLKQIDSPEFTTIEELDAHIAQLKKEW